MFQRRSRVSHFCQELFDVRQQESSSQTLCEPGRNGRATPASPPLADPWGAEELAASLDGTAALRPPRRRLRTLGVRKSWRRLWIRLGPPSGRSIWRGAAYSSTRQRAISSAGPGKNASAKTCTAESTGA